MARPVKTRTPRTYERDIEHLNRLRMALLMDRSLDSARVNRTKAVIDKLITELIELKNSLAA